MRISHRTWPAALAFGLPPGPGFACAPAGICLPEHAIPLAFLFSDLGVESGRRIFIGAFFGLWFLLQKLSLSAWG